MHGAISIFFSGVCRFTVRFKCNNYSYPFVGPFPPAQSDMSWDECKRALGLTDTPNWLGGKQPPPYAVISSKVDESHRGIRNPARR